MVTKEHDVAEALNTYFTEIGTNLSANNLSSSDKIFAYYIAPVSSRFINFSIITNIIVFKILLIS